MSTGQYAVGENRGFQILTILIIVGLLSVVAIPRYIDTRRDMQREAQVTVAHNYIRALHGALTVNSANHYLRGAEWVVDGEELMERLEDGRGMPKSMRYADNVWTDVESGLKWEFTRASDKLPPRIKRVHQRLPPEPWEMEPIRRVSRTSLPES
jgi:hypothetical protein